MQEHENTSTGTRVYAMTGKYHHGSLTVKTRARGRPDERESHFQALLLRAVAAIRRDTNRADIAREWDSGRDTEGVIDAIKWESGLAILRGGVKWALHAAYESGARAAAMAMPKVRKASAAIVGVLDAVSPTAIEATATRAAELIAEFGSSSIDAIRDILIKAMSGDLSGPEIAKQLMDSGIGLTSKSASAVQRYREGLEDEGGYTAAEIDRLVQAKYDKALRQRADLIARTEIMRASRDGNQELWAQAKEDGLLDDRAVQQWHAEPGACPKCEPLDDQTAPIGGQFPGEGGDGPPLHPACRCTLTMRPTGI